MKGLLAVILGGVTLACGVSSVSAATIINCPHLKLKNYGQSSYYDPKISRFWRLKWYSKTAPVWSQVSIPQTTTCGSGMTRNGVPLKYQCAVFMCKSDAVVASLGENHRGIKCFSAYTSTQNTFYCNSFSMN
jgi:hypothetical protein